MHCLSSFVLSLHASFTAVCTFASTAPLITAKTVVSHLPIFLQSHQPHPIEKFGRVCRHSLHDHFSHSSTINQRPPTIEQPVKFFDSLNFQPLSVQCPSYHHRPSLRPQPPRSPRRFLAQVGIVGIDTSRHLTHLSIPQSSRTHRPGMRRLRGQK